MLSRRLAVLVIASPLAFYVACKDDDSSTDAPLNTNISDGGSSGGGDGGGDGTSDSGTVDNGHEDAAGIAASCEGNPLSPDSASIDSRVVVDAARLRALATGNFLDGPQWIDDGTGAIVYSEVNAQTIVRNAPDGGSRTPLREISAAELPIGNAVAGGFIFTAVSGSDGGGSILRMLLDGGNPITYPSAPASSPNDIVGSSKGFVYFTDPAFQSPSTHPVTGVYRMTLEGAITPVEQFDAGDNPGARADGIALTADGTTLYVGFYDERRIAKYAIDDAGVATNPQSLAFGPTDVPTGLAVDTVGNLWIAENDPSGTIIRGRVEVFDKSGRKWGEIPFADSRPTGIAFGGNDGRTVYITTERGDVTLGTLYAFTSRCPGVR